MEISLNPNKKLLLKYGYLFYSQNSKKEPYTRNSNIFKLQLPIKISGKQTVEVLKEFNDLIKTENITKDLHETFLYIILTEYLFWMSKYDWIELGHYYRSEFKVLSRVLERIEKEDYIFERIDFYVSPKKALEKKEPAIYTLKHPFIIKLFTNGIQEQIKRRGFMPFVDIDTHDNFSKRQWEKIYQRNDRHPYRNKGLITAELLVWVLNFIENETEIKAKKNTLVNKHQARVLVRIGNILGIFSTKMQESDDKDIIKYYFRKYLQSTP